MGKEKSPFDGKRMSINKLGEVMGYLIKHNRTIWLSMYKGSKVILREGSVVMGPFPNWKAYKVLCQILAFEQDSIKQKQVALAAIKGKPLFVLPTHAVKPTVFTPPGS